MKPRSVSRFIDVLLNVCLHFCFDCCLLFFSFMFHSILLFRCDFLSFRVFLDILLLNFYLFGKKMENFTSFSHSSKIDFDYKGLSPLCRAKYGFAQGRFYLYFSLSLTV